MEPGRPSIYSQELAEAICLRLSEGESLRSICEDDDMPSKSTVLLWVVENREGFSDHYAQARMVQAYTWAEEIVDIADNESKDWHVDEDGNLIVEREQVARSRLRVDTRKWLLSKVLPKVYGDKVALEHTGKDGGPIEHRDVSDDELLKRADQLTNRVAAFLPSTNGNGNGTGP